MTKLSLKNCKRDAQSASVFVLFEIANRPRLLKWFAAGLAFMAISTGFLYLLVDLAEVSVPIATLITAEVCTLLRFLVNHYWVFGMHGATLKECLQYHVANAGAFVIWWVIANLLVLVGMNYLVAGMAAVGFSTLFSLTSNFFWVWRRHH